jgi:hypothetical protein
MSPARTPIVNLALVGYASFAGFTSRSPLVALSTPQCSERRG